MSALWQQAQLAHQMYLVLPDGNDGFSELRQHGLQGHPVTRSKAQAICN